jgi:trk system potassium uptake protein TrkA
VTIVDASDATLSRTSDRMDVMCVKGNGASIAALRAAGVQDTDIVIAATNLDEVNMVCCLTAKRLGAKYTIARIRSVEYTTDLSTLRRELRIDTVINPEYATAVEISACSGSRPPPVSAPFSAAARSW